MLKEDPPEAQEDETSWAGKVERQDRFGCDTPISHFLHLFGGPFGEDLGVE